MAVTNRTSSPPESYFGITQAVWAAMILLFGALLSVAFVTVKVQAMPLADFLSYLSEERVAPDILTWLSYVSWVAEAAVYFLLAYSYSQQQLVAAAIAVPLGISIRVVATFIIAVLLSGNQHVPLSEMVPKAFVTLWIFRVLAILSTALIFHVCLQRLIEAGYGFLTPTTSAHPARKPRKPVKKVENTAGQFSFKMERKHNAPSVVPRPAEVAADNANELHPPQDFIPLPPKDDVTGLVNIPIDVICDSVPEARALLKKEFPVRVRIAYLVPQLPRSTVWLTWDQIFLTTPDDPNKNHGPNRPDAQFQNRWIRIPAKHYVKQVSMEYFAKKSEPAPLWMKRPAVPQEAQFQSTSVK